MAIPDPEQFATESDEIIALIRPILAGRAPEMQGFVLAELLGIYIAGYDPVIRKEMLLFHVKTACMMTKLYDRHTQH